MSIEDIINIEGKPGLFKIITKTKNGLIAESLEDKKRIPVFASSNVSAFKDISIYTKEDNCPIKDVFVKISEKENGEKSIDPNSNPKELKDYFKIVLPDYDEEQVYVSHIKKTIKWYNQLVGLGLLADLLKEDENKEKEKDNSEAGNIPRKEVTKKAHKTNTPRANTRAKGGGIKNTTKRKAS